MILSKPELVLINLGILVTGLTMLTFAESYFDEKLESGHNEYLASEKANYYLQLNTAITVARIDKTIDIKNQVTSVQDLIDLGYMVKDTPIVNISISFDINNNIQVVSFDPEITQDMCDIVQNKPLYSLEVKECYQGHIVYAF